jgi:LysM repeat protein
MNNPNPFIPQGSLLEQKNRKRTRFQIAVFSIFAINVLVIAPLLIQGCKRENTDAPSTQTTSDTAQPTPAPATNDTTVSAAPQATNPVVAQQSTPQPTIEPQPTPAPAPQATEYVIVRGDTLDSIHKKFSVSVKAIEDANPGIVPTKLHVGQKIQVPAAAAPTSTGNATVAADGSEMYVVKAGDNLSKIASSHGTTIKAIETLNNLKSTKIKAGDKLKMPPPKATPPAAVTTPAPAPAPAPATTPAPPAPASQ